MKRKPVLTSSTNRAASGFVAVEAGPSQADGLKLGSHQHSRPRVLFVDDEQAVLVSFARILQRLENTRGQEGNGNIPFDAAFSLSGEEAVALVEQSVENGCPFDVVFVDIEMPGLDGLGAVDRIWAVDPQIQVVVCSGCIERRADEIAEKLGASHRHVVLRKPFIASEVQQLIQMLHKKRFDSECSMETSRACRALTMEYDNFVESVNQRLKEATSQREHIEGELLEARKLEAMGHLAAGIAHEINTPIQFVSDNIQFLEECFTDLVGLRNAYLAVLGSQKDTAVCESYMIGLREADEDADWEYIAENAPLAFVRAREGLDRVASIVRAMKDCAYLNRQEKAPADINKAIQSTLTIAKNEYKYVAEVETRFAELPPVSCFVGDLNQVFLNMVVNAAHAIEAVVRGTQEKGKITITTRAHDAGVQITIGDTGCGISQENQEKIFEPFFTTKEQGKGTGQGLAISRTIVEEKHQGTLEVQSELEKGTTFLIWLPADVETAP